MAALAALAAAPGTAVAAPTPALADRLAQSAPGDRIAVIATFADQVPDGADDGRPAALLRALRRTAAGDAAAIADDVEGPVRPFWLVNAAAFTGTPDEIRTVAADPAVASVDLDAPVRVADAGADAVPTPFPDAGTGDWGLDAIRAREAWTTFGVRGEGIRIGSIDTGVDAGAKDLAGKVAAWHDFVGSSATPVDDNGHGTHTAGTMVGGSAGGAPIGVAPGARLLVARAMGANGSGSGSALLAAAQWMTDPDGDPATADQPAIVNNSWSASTANDTWFRPMIRRWLDLGIVPVFAAGNTGPSAGSVGSPAGYPEALAVGAVDSDGGVPSFSSRGPVVWQDPDGLGPSAGTVLQKPDLVAPGVGITSSVGTGWLSYSGTSMAAPHVAGVAALVRQLNPSLGPEEVADVLRASATDIGAPGVDPASGFGRVDAVRALERAFGPAPDTQFVSTPAAVTNARSLVYEVGLANGGVQVRSRVDGGPWGEATSDTTLRLTLPEGRHVVEAQAIDAAGVADPSPARHAVTIDRTAPVLRIAMSREGTRSVFHSTTRGASGPVRWSFGEGDTAAGGRVVRRFAEGRPRRVVAAVADAAGNRRFVVRTFTPAAAGAVRALRVPAVVRVGRAVPVSGRLVRRAAVTALLRPVRAGATQSTAPAAAFTVEAVGAPVAKAASSARGPARFRLSVPGRALRPGVYRLEVSAAEAGTTLGRLHIVRRVTVR
ncbi:MAG TPA: S8 family serine peptidase [Miltoncostaea sp.]|nr:S8 family serine peptidase [Miltoncostaea sp.]